MTARAWLFVVAILSMICGLGFDNFACQVISVGLLLGLFLARNSVE